MFFVSLTDAQARLTPQGYASMQSAGNDLYRDSHENQQRGKTSKGKIYCYTFKNDKTLVH